MGIVAVRCGRTVASGAGVVRIDLCPRRVCPSSVGRRHCPVCRLRHPWSCPSASGRRRGRRGKISGQSSNGAGMESCYALDYWRVRRRVPRRRDLRCYIYGSGPFRFGRVPGRRPGKFFPHVRQRPGLLSAPGWCGLTCRVLDGRRRNPPNRQRTVRTVLGIGRWSTNGARGRS